MKILVIEDDELVIQALTTMLTAHNYAVEVATTGREGLALIETFDYDLIVMDIMLPQTGSTPLDGIQLCQQVRSQDYQMPILLLTRRDSPHDRAIGLDAGADDYVVKPFDPEELLARIRALLRRVSTTVQPLLEWGDLLLDPSACEATYGTTVLPLTPKEYALIELFLRNSRRVFSCGAILEHLWAYEDTPGEEAVRTHIKGLRQKLRAAGAPADFIETVYGIGYRLKPIASPSSESRPFAQEMRSKLQAVWQRSLPRIDQQIRVLEQAATPHEALDEDFYAQAYREAHTLAGALGTFGFTEGTRLAREIDHLLGQIQGQQRSLKPKELQQLQDLIAALRRSIDCPAQSRITPTAGSQNSSQNSLQTSSQTSSQDGSRNSSQNGSRNSANDSTKNGSKSDDRSTYQPMTIQNQATTDLPVILAVDSDREFTTALSQTAAQSGFQLAIAPSLSTAKRFLSNHSPTVVLLDLQSVGSHQQGLALIQSCHQQIPPIPTLVFTQHDDLTHRLEIIRQGGRLLLQKPIAPAQVFEAVQQMIQRTATAQVKVLIVDDDVAILAMLKSLLEPWGLKVVTLADPHRFLETLETCAPDLLILDIKFPDLNGIELCQVVRNDLRWSDLPILFLTAHNDTMTINDVFSVGADDFVSKPVVGPELVTRIINRLERMKLIRHLAEVDPLTGVTNSTKSTQELENFLRLAERWQQPVALAVLDIDRMRQLNDEHGQASGDRILRQLGGLLKQLFRSEDIVARWGGEEFVIGMYGITQAEGIQRLLQVLQALQQQGGRISEETTIPVTFSAGVAQYPEDGTDVRSLYRSAVAALQQAKQSGRSCVLPTRGNQVLSR